MICSILSEFTKKREIVLGTSHSKGFIKTKQNIEKVDGTKLGTFLGLAPSLMNEVLVSAIQVSCHRNCFDCYRCQ